MNSTNKRLTPKQAQPKIEKYCAYQERSQQEVRQKLYTYGLCSDDVESIIANLIQSNFINEERYSKMFAWGKFRQKHWGRNKILHELKGKGVSERNIKTALNEIVIEEYDNSLLKLIERLKKQYAKPGLKDWQKKQKVIKALMLKGYEFEKINEQYDKEI
jgi:regulatory protein